MKTIVVYKSKSGFARRYAELIASELTADLLEHSRVSVGMLAGYDAIVYGGGLYVGGINGVKLITGNLDALQGKRIAVFATGATPPRAEAMQEVISNNFTAEQLKQLKFFYLRGGFDYAKLKPVDKVLMILMKLKIKWRKLTKKELHPDETGMLAAYDKPLDLVKQKNIEGLVEYIKQGI